jgi:hypothetical protein
VFGIWDGSALAVRSHFMEGCIGVVS